MCLGIPGRIVEITDGARLLAVADVSGVRREVNVACVLEGDLEDLVGKWALIHVGFAMSLIDEAEAAKTLAALSDLGEAQETLREMAAGEAALAGPVSGGAGDGAGERR
jgi:hydrogenase expression/formation protein HypC